MHWGLFYRGDYRVPNLDGDGILISEKRKADFSTYLNGFPLNKWKLYTNLRSLCLELEASGKFAVNLVGYSLEPNFPCRHEYSSTQLDLKNAEKITLDYPNIESCKQEFLAFEILTYGGAFYDEADVNHVNLAIATATFRKEEFVKHNVALIKKELLESNDEIASHLFMHVVDNGRTLSETDISSRNVYLWHMSGKYNPATDLYQSFRNIMIGKATGSFDEDVKMLERMKHEFRRLVLEFAYDSAELVLLALEDYIRGYEFLEKADGEFLMKEHGTLNEKMLPLDNFSEIEINIRDVYFDPPRKRLKHFLFRLIYNGHRFFPKSLLKKKPAVIGYDWSYQPAKQAFRRQMLAVNPTDRTAHLRIMDKKRFRELTKRYRKDIRQLKKHGAEIEKKWRDAMERLTSEAFWHVYLGI